MAAKTLKAAHIAIVTPHQAGLYETARDLVEAERAIGLDARIVDPVKDVKQSGADRGVPIVPRRFAEQADILINHSGLGPMNKLNKPIIHIFHGRPYSSYLLEQKGKIAVYSFWRKISGDPRYKYFVTFWPEFQEYYTPMFPAEKVKVVLAPVNLTRWTPNGPSGYGFHGNKGEINVVVADLWRHDITPYHVLHSFLLFAKTHPGARLHIYAAPSSGTSWGILLSVLRESGHLGEVAGMIKGLENVYRAADMVITPHRIATRTVRESLACGCQLVKGPGGEYTTYQADPEKLHRYSQVMERAWRDKNGIKDVSSINRQQAERWFNPAQTAKAFVQLIESAIG